MDKKKWADGLLCSSRCPTTGGKKEEMVQQTTEQNCRPTTPWTPSRERWIDRRVSHRNVSWASAQVAPQPVDFFFFPFKCGWYSFSTAQIYNTQDLEMLWDDSILFGITRCRRVFFLPEHCSAEMKDASDTDGMLPAHTTKSSLKQQIRWRLQHSMTS